MNQGEYQAERALRRLMGKAPEAGPLQVVKISELGHEKANGKDVVQVLRSTPTNPKKDLPPLKKELLAERQEIEALRLLNQTGVTSSPLPAPKKGILRLMDEE